MYFSLCLKIFKKYFYLIFQFSALAILFAIFTTEFLNCEKMFLVPPFLHLFMFLGVLTVIILSFPLSLTISSVPVTVMHSGSSAQLFPQVTESPQLDCEFSMCAYWVGSFCTHVVQVVRGLSGNNELEGIRRQSKDFYSSIPLASQRKNGTSLWCVCVHVYVAFLFSVFLSCKQKSA